MQSEAIISLLQLIAAFPSRVALKYTSRIDAIQPFIFSNRDVVRDSASQLIAFVLLSCPAAQRTFYFTGLLAILKSQFDCCIVHLWFTFSFELSQLERFDGAQTALGYAIGYACSQEHPLREDPVVVDAVDMILKNLYSPTMQLVVSSCKVHISFRFGSYLQAIGHMGRFVSLFTATSNEGARSELITRLAKLAIRTADGKDEKLNESAVRALGLISLGDDYGRYFDAVTALFPLSSFIV